MNYNIFTSYAKTINQFVIKLVLCNEWKLPPVFLNESEKTQFQNNFHFLSQLDQKYIDIIDNNNNNNNNEKAMNIRYAFSLGKTNEQSYTLLYIYNNSPLFFIL